MSEVPSKLRWACRRGMLELDVLLGNFLEEAYLHLSDSDKAVFEKLLSCQDQELFEWFTGKKISTNSQFQLMVAKILEHARNRR
jgi:antitoxin CptB